jgi:hypothetical protein
MNPLDCLLGIVIGMMAGFVLAIHGMINVIRDGKDATVVDGKVQFVERKIETEEDNVQDK